MSTRAARSSWRTAIPLVAALAWLLVIGLARAGVPAPGHLLAPVATLAASLVQPLVRLAGIEALRHGALLYVPGTFAYEVVIGCTGLLPVAVLVVAILASRGARAALRRGLLVGVPLLLMLNLVRLAHLFYLGVRAPEAFPVAHAWIWDGVLVMAVLALWRSASLREQPVEQLE
jgi:exosortase/archaeosortase family protein